jgi:uridine kinase/putative flippase GtrA
MRQVALEGLREVVLKMGKLKDNEAARFVVVGLASTVINYSIFIILYSQLSMPYLVSSACGYVSGVLFGFRYNKKITFKSKNNYRSELIKYFMVYLFSLLLGLAILKTAVSDYSLNPSIGNIISIAFTTITNFLGCKFFVFRKTHIPRAFLNRVFLSVLAAKIIFCFLFASNYMVDGTIPFIDYFISSGFQNPYNHFLDIGAVKAFPYSLTMLLIESAPTYLFYAFLGDTTVSFISLLLARVPLLLADLTIFYILLQLLKTKDNEVIFYYWCSPIIFYISYFHGQLDAIPTALLMLAIYFLLLKKERQSALLLGVSLACKANVFIAVPFILLFLWRNRTPAIRIATYVLLSLAVYAVLVSPYLITEGYKKMVLSAEEQSWVLMLSIPLTVLNLVIYVVPLFYVVFFFRLMSFKNLNQDGLIMSIAVAFISLVIFVPPMPGWFYWTVPFLSYFFIRYDHSSKKYYYALNLFYILHFFIFSMNSDMFQSLQIINEGLSASGNVYHMLAARGFDAALISSFVFSMFEGVLIINAYNVYQKGVINNLVYRSQPIGIGIAGDSGSGKSHTNKLLSSLVGEHNITLLEGDDLHKWERGDVNWNVQTHLNPKSNVLHADIENIRKIKTGTKIKRNHYDHSSGKFIPSVEISPSRFIVVSGLHSFYLQQMRRVLDIKIFLELDESLRRHWKISRDMKDRGYSKEKVIAQIEQRCEDSKKFIQPQKEFSDLVVTYRLQSEIKNLGDPEEKIDLGLSLTLSNNYDIDKIMNLLEPVETLQKEAHYNEDAKTITCRFYGHIPKEEIQKIAYTLVPNLEEVIENRNPIWRSGYDGLVQLFIVYLISEHIKADTLK